VDINEKGVNKKWYFCKNRGNICNQTSQRALNQKSEREN
jgi:hypothetical protein